MIHGFFADWQRFFPFLQWRSRVNSHSFKQDLIAGLTGAIVVLPQGVAFATIAGMPPEYGLYAGMIPAVVAALFGSSWHLVSGPTTAASILLFSVLSTHAEPLSTHYVQYAITLTFMVGVIELALGAARLGTLINFISHSVVIGFTAGAAILIATSQVKNFFGIDIARGTSFIDTWSRLLHHVGDINPYVFAISIATLLIGILTKHFSRAIPYMIAAMVGGSLVSLAINYWFGTATTAIAVVGALPATLPPLSHPVFDLATLKELATASLAVALLALTEAVSIARAMAVRSGQHLNGNQEFIGQGLSNILGSFFSAYVATGSFNRSGLNYTAGAQTPLASVISSVLLVAIVLLIAPVAAYLPNAAMAGVLFLVAWGLIDFKHIRQIIQSGYTELSILLTTFFATLFLSLEMAILLGVILSLGFYMNRASRPSIARRVPDPNHPKRKFTGNPNLPECPQLKIVRMDGALFFGAVVNVQESLLTMHKTNPGQKHLAVVATGVNFVDLSGAEFLLQEARRRRALGGDLWLVRIRPEVVDEIDEAGCLDGIGKDHIFSSRTEALAGIYPHLDPKVCQTCKYRIFRECQTQTTPDELQQPSAGMVTAVSL
ncbi:MAG: SulP family inorganic anion transporter [Gammaproteobacteria bacterium]|nr:SulP family inorganic anion transporter [Gammaproteobacteria bacterium]